MLVRSSADSGGAAWRGYLLHGCRRPSGQVQVVVRRLCCGEGVSRSGRGLGGQGEQVEDPHLGEPVTAPGKIMPDRLHCYLVEVQVVLVAADESERALCERDLGAGVVVSQVRLDHAVEHGDQRRARRTGLVVTWSS